MSPAVARGAGHVLHAGTNALTRMAAGAGRWRAWRRSWLRRGHIVLHLLHPIGGLNGNAAVSKVTPFPQPRWTLARASAAGSRARSLPRFGAALATPSSAPCEFLHLIAIQHFALQAGFRRHFAATSAWPAESAVGRLIDQIRVKFCAPHDPPALDRGIQSRRPRPAQTHHRFLCRRWFYTVGFEIARMAPSITARHSRRRRIRIQGKATFLIDLAFRKRTAPR